MDLTTLSQVFLASIDADVKIRQAAEHHLNSYTSDPNIPFACLTLAVSNKSHPAVQQSAAVFLKNLVLKYWKSSVANIENQPTTACINPQSPPELPPLPAFAQTLTESAPEPLSPFRDFSHEQVLQFKQQILYSLRLASPVVLNYLTNIFTTFLQTSGIPQWHDLSHTIIKMLSDPDPTVIFPGILISLETIRYTNTLPFLSPQTIQTKSEIVSLLFPHLFKISQSLSSETNSHAGLMLWKILKCYKLAICYDFPDFLQQESQLQNWLSLFLLILSTTHPLSDPADKTHQIILPTSKNTLPFSSETSPSSNSSFAEPTKLDYGSFSPNISWQKCQKWACIILSHLMTTYACKTKPNVISIQQKDFSRFTDIFIQYFVPDISKAFIHNIEKWGDASKNSQTLLLSSPAAVCSIISYFEVVATMDDLWAQILPKMDVIVSNLIFGTLICSDADLEAFYYNPEEYILSNIENLDFSTRGKDLKFLSLLVKERHTDMFQGILFLINQACTKYHENPHNPQLCLEKDAALQVMIQLEAEVSAPDSPISSQINSFILEQVVGDSQFACTTPQNLFLLARSCEVVETFQNVSFSKTEQEKVLEYVLRCFNYSEAVMVKYKAAFALKTLFTTYDHICALLGPQISQVMQKMLDLYEEVNSESLSFVLEEMIDTFTAQLAPFSEQLCTQLSYQFIRILTEISDRENRMENTDTDEFLFVEDHQMVAVGILNALNTLSLALEKSPSHIAKLEPCLIPVFKLVIENSNYAFYQEIFELIDTCLYSPRRITSNMAQVVGMMRIGFQKDPSQCCEYYGPVLCNFFNFSLPNTPKQTHSSAQKLICKENGLAASPYPAGLTDLSFDLVFRFLSTTCSGKEEEVSAEDTNVAATLAQTMFLTSAAAGVPIDTGANHKRLIDLVYCCLTSLSQPVPSALAYRNLIEIILAAAVYDPAAVCAYLITSSCFDWIVQVALTHHGLFYRAYDNALAAIALLNMAAACSQRSDAYREMFPKVVQPVLQFVSKYYQLSRAQSPLCDVACPGAYPTGHEAASNANGQQPAQFTFVVESFDSGAPSGPAGSVNSEPVQQMMEAEPALDNAIEGFNVFCIYSETVRWLTSSAESDKTEGSNDGDDNIHKYYRQELDKILIDKDLELHNFILSLAY